MPHLPSACALLPISFYIVVTNQPHEAHFYTIFCTDIIAPSHNIFIFRQIMPYPYFKLVANS
ncbi:hypothetical protein SAMN05444380_10366 [Thermophagus xiamenensis]|uniref:Uncharacterized protein n=1 Tax=Thermophagus xiamenensis TaxID=385682 RepID=A0A1I1VTQ4_9BACT|nr:hypothetical protein SAMN05444380_10366 [Thermophagus xiamenensis]